MRERGEGSHDSIVDSKERVARVLMVTYINIYIYMLS